MIYILNDKVLYNVYIFQDTPGSYTYIYIYISNLRIIKIGSLSSQNIFLYHTVNR